MSKELTFGTPRTEAIIAKVMAEYPGDSPKEQAKYFEAVHQKLAPLCRELEREVAWYKAQMQEAWRGLADKPKGK